MSWKRVEPQVGRRVREGVAALDSVDLASFFKRRAHVMRSVPVVTKGADTAGMRMFMDEVLRSKRVHDVESGQLAWKLFLLPPAPADASLRAINGQWDQKIAHRKLRPSVRQRRREAVSDLERRAARTEKLVALGEFSAGIGGEEAKRTAKSSRRSFVDTRSRYMT